MTNEVNTAKPREESQALPTTGTGGNAGAEDRGLEGRLVLSVKELAQALGIGHNKAYELIHKQGFPSVWIGNRCVIPVNRLKSWLDKQAEEGGKV